MHTSQASTEPNERVSYSAEPIEPATGEENKEAPKHRRRSRGMWLLAPVALVVGLVCGGFLGDPTSSDEYQELLAENEGLRADKVELRESADIHAQRRNDARAEVAELQSVIDGYDEREAELEQRSVALDERETELDDRDAELTTQEEEIKSNTFGSGTWTVGVDVAPGTYRSTGVTGSCYWGIYVSGTNKDNIVTNDFIDGGRPSVTLREGQDFQSRSGCGSWEKQ